MLSGKLEFVSTGGVATVTVTGQSIARPRLAIAPATVEIPESTDSTDVVVKNAGKGGLLFSVSAAHPWVTLRVDRTFIQRTDSAIVRVIADKRPLPAGATTSSLVFRSSTGRDSVTKPLTVRVSSAPRASLSPSRAGFASGENSRTLRLHNVGKGALTWTVPTTPAWLSIVPALGTVAPGDSATLTVAVTRSALPAPDIRTSIDITTNSVDGPVTLPIVVTSSSGFARGLRFAKQCRPGRSREV